MRRRDGVPLWVDQQGGSVAALRRIDLGGKDDDCFDEKWLQRLLQENPGVFPIEQIEPGFGELIPLCTELPVNFGGGRSGKIDNLFATDQGGLALIETKLWRNPEARRAAVAQAMEYAAAVFEMGYQQLEAGILAKRKADGRSVGSLYEIVQTHSAAACDEAEFIDALSLNLARGRAVIALVGDGIREDIAPLARLLQSHAGHRFTFALVELAVYQSPSADGVLIVTPSVLAQTKFIERGVIRLEGDARSLKVVAPDEVPTQAIGARRAIGIGEDEFYEILSKRDSSMPVALKNFLAKADELGVYPDRQNGLSLKHDSPLGRPLNLGTIRKDGFVETDPATWWGRKSAGQRYNETLATAIGGSVREMVSGQQSAVRTAAGKTPQLSDLLPRHETVWLDAMRRYIQDTFDAAPAEP